MARDREEDAQPSVGPPGSFPRTAPPPEYLPATDNLYVAHNIGKLTEAVERLTGDVKAQGGKIDTLTGQASFIKGALWVGGFAVTGVMGLIYYLLNAKWEELIKAIQPLLEK